MQYHMARRGLVIYLSNKEIKMSILVLNCGSSSLKYQLIDMKDEKVLAKGRRIR